MTSKFPIIAGVFEIVLACTCMFFSSIGLIIHIADTPQPEPQIILITYGIVAFVFGLMGGIFAVKRIHFVLTLIGALSTLCWAILADWVVVTMHSWGVEDVILGNVMILFSFLSLAFLLASRTEFT